MDFYHSYYRDLLKPPQKHSTGDQGLPKSRTAGISSSGATDLIPGPVATEGQHGEADTQREAQIQTREAQVGNNDKPVRAEEHAAPTRPAKQLSKEVLDAEGLDVVLCGLLSACEERVQNIKTQCGEYRADESTVEPQNICLGPTKYAE